MPLFRVDDTAFSFLACGFDSWKGNLSRLHGKQGKRHTVHYKTQTRKTEDVKMEDRL